MPIKDRVKKLLRQRAFFFKLLMSITGLICIPLIALQIYMIGRSTNEYKKSTQEMYLSVLQQYALNFSSQEQVLSKVAWRISMDEAVQKPLKHNATEYSWYLASESLNHYGKENLYVSYTGVYYTAKGYILADGIKNTLKDFSKRYSADAEQQEQLCAFFLNLSLPDYYATVDGGTLFSAFPVSLGSAGINDAVVFFAIDAHLLEKSYRNSVSPDTSLAVIDSQGNFLLQGASFVTDVSLNAVTTLLGKNTDIYTVTTENDIQLYKYQDPVSNFTFLLSVNRNEIQQKLIDFASGIRSTLYFALILLGVLLSITLYINYRPIHLLLERYTTSQADEEEHSELERLGSAFFALDERLSAQKSLLIDFLLGDLLFTTSANQELVQQYFPPGKYCSFVVISAKCPTVTTG
ncbi:MAG: hypothetical protein IJB35_01705, partial [Oscillospiraceae bacterium]|nr:hypothetical protein [Oscillospiraceae bacterium]